MKLGKSLSELALEIERQAINKKDYISDTRSLTIRSTQESVELVMDNGTGVELPRLAIGAQAHTACSAT